MQTQHNSQGVIAEWLQGNVYMGGINGVFFCAFFLLFSFSCLPGLYSVVISYGGGLVWDPILWPVNEGL